MHRAMSGGRAAPPPPAMPLLAPAARAHAASRVAPHAADGCAQARHTIAVQHVEQILLGAQRLGHDIDALLRRAGISPALLLSPNARVSQGQYAALMRSLRRVMRDEFCGLLSRPVLPGALAQACAAAIHCATLGDALRALVRHYRLLIDDFAPRLRVQDGRASLVLVPQAPATPCSRFAESTFVFHGYGLLCWLLARRLPISAVELSAAPHAQRNDTERIFGAEVAYGRARTALHFDAAWLRLPLAQDGSSLQRFLRSAPRDLLVRYRDDCGLAERIRRQLRCQLDGELPSLEAVAATLQLTPQTLRRRLREEGRGYQSIKDDLRRDAAIGLLERSDLPLHQVALRLGYSEPSTFHRAFKKWTGVAPGEYRHRQLAAGLAAGA